MLIVAGFLMIGFTVAPSVLEGKTITEIPDKEKDIKKDTAKESKKAHMKKSNISIQIVSESTSSQEEAALAHNETYTDNPALNDDCTKEGFDRE